MNSYIDIKRNENVKNIRKERVSKGLYTLTETCALLICALVNFFSSLVSVLRNDTVALVVRGVCACVAVVLLVGTVCACESGAVTFAGAIVRAVVICGATFVVFNLFGEE